MKQRACKRLLESRSGLEVLKFSGALDRSGAIEKGRRLPQSRARSRPNCAPGFRIVFCLFVLVVSSLAQSPALHRLPNTTLRLPPNLDDPALLPPTLADTGAFSDLIHLTPNAGIVAYDLNVPLWSDGAHKSRWFSLPDTNLMIGFEREIPWSFPIGSVWIKHFELPLKDGDLNSARRIETRFLVRNNGGAYGVTYRWDDSQTNATLVASEGLEEDIDIQEGGETRTQVWHYPSRSECLRCHNQVGGWALGFNTPQLNRELNDGAVTNNQIAALREAGYFSNKVTGIHTLRALAAPANTAWSLEYRVRSYLAANCVQCHQPGGAHCSFWDARITNPTAAAEIINGPLLYSFAVYPNGRVIVPGSLELSTLFYRISHLDSFHMPPLATTVLNMEAVNLLSEWITNGLANYQSFADWQTTFFNSTEIASAAADADPDGDGAPNQLEYLVGGNPLVRSDAWAISIHSAASGLQVTFPRVANRMFEVQGTTRLNDPQSWSVLDIPANRPFFSATNGNTVIEDLDKSSSVKFYRVRVFAP